ncbi:MAG TPA: MinD/ParA family protein [Natronoarchaeum rubrum]|nr:MinD/ParA family protein [Natronoarchaeum rubrum]
MSGTTVYAVASGKGGVGKTTTTVNLGTALAGAGKRVAIVDADLGMANLAGFVSLAPDGATLHDVLAGDAEVPEATYEVADGIAAVPSGTELDEFADADAAGLGDAVDRLRGEFDYVLLDVGAGVSHESVLPLGVADEVLLVSTPEPASVQDVRKTIDLVDRSGGSVAGLVVTRGRPDGDVSYEEIAARLDVDLLGSIPEDPTVRDSVYAGTPLVVHEAESPAATAYRQLAASLADGVQASASAAAGSASTAEDDSGAEDEADDAASDDADETAADEGDAAPDDVADAVSEAAPDATADEESNASADDAADADAAPADPEEPASETSVEDAISEIDEADDAADDAASEPEGAVAVGGDGSTTREADAEEVEGAVTIPDAEAEAEAEADADADAESEDPLDLDDDAIPFSGDDADAAAADDAETESDDDDSDEDEDAADSEDAADAEDDDSDEDDGGFLGGIF